MALLFQILRSNSRAFCLSSQVLIFKDSGSSAREEDRFQPKAELNDEQPQYEKMYVDVTTGEEYVPQAVEPKVESEESPESAAQLSAPAPPVLPHLRQSLRMLSANGGLSSQSTSASASPANLNDEDAMAADAVVKSEIFDEDLADDLALENSSLINDIMDMDDEDELEANADGVASVGVGSSALDADNGSKFMDDDDLEADLAEEVMSQQNGGDLYYENQMKLEPEDAKSELEEDAAEADEPAPTGLTRKNGTKLRIDMAAVAAAAAAASSEDSDSNDSDSSSSSSSSSSSCSGSSCSSSDSSYLSSDDEKIEEAKDIKSVAEDEEMEESIANDEAGLSVVNPPQKS